MAQFWRENPFMFGNVEAFFLPQGDAGPEAFRAFLEKKPESLNETLKRVVPEQLHNTLGISDWSWIIELFDDKRGVLKKVTDEVRGDIEILESIWPELVKQRKSPDYIWRIIKTLKSRSIIDILSSRNVLPKYGFPVDVVELQVLNHGEEAKRLELDRDLRIALSEYAPESQIVAGGRLWTSYGLKKLPQRAWPEYQYAICGKCQRYQRILVDTGILPSNCVTCGTPLEDRRVKGSFVIPEFGFVTGSNPPGYPGETRPERTHTTRVYFSGESSPWESRAEFQANTVRLLVSSARNGRLAVINKAGFMICHQCGFAIRIASKIPKNHKTPWGHECHGVLKFYDLGHEFQTDVLDLHFDNYTNPNKSFWLSLLYALLEGASEVLHTNRDDLDGCLYPYSSEYSTPAIIMFDDVPGGAGHVHRLAKDGDILRDLLVSTRKRLDGSCGCDSNTSCYGCLRNYRNQYCHDELKRGVVLEFINNLLN
jgi:hypothetical protein